MRRITTFIAALAVLLSVTAFAANDASAHPYFMPHKHYAFTFCNYQTGHAYLVYDWQYPSGAHWYYEWVSRPDLICV